MTAKPTIQLVKQPDTYGCGLACIAMIAHMSYEEVKDLAGDALATREGCRPELLWYLLSYLGFHCQIRLRANHEKWPVFDSDYHILLVNASFSPHWVLLHEGKIFDPAEDEIQYLIDYDDVKEVIGVNRV